MKFAVPIWIADAPASINSTASFQFMIPPNPMTGIFTALATCQTMRNAIGFTAAPVYTRPADYNGWKVPDILLSGHEAKIKEWELQQSLERTKRLRPDLLEE